MKAALVYTASLLLAILKSSRQQFPCQSLPPLDSQLYNTLFEAKEIILPLDNSSADISSPQHINGSNCTYKIDSGSYVITGKKCDAIPQNVSLNHEALTIEDTDLRTVVAHAFDSYTNLQVLHIRKNRLLKSIKSSAFADLSKLVNLTITANEQLEIFEKGCFSGLDNLQQLSLLGNKITRISYISPVLNPIHLPKLSFLDLRENTIVTVDENDFKAMAHSTLKSLVLSSSQTESIHYKALDPLSNLEKIIFTQNKINGTVAGDLINHLRKVNKKLRHLSLAANPLYKNPMILLKAVAASTISYLDIGNNYFLEMGPGFFPYMPQIKRLDISNVMINDLSDTVLNSTLMPNLKELYVSKNDLRELSSSWSWPNLEKLDLSYINNNNLAWNIVFKIKYESFKEMPTLEWLSFAGTRIVSVDTQTFSQARNLKYLSLRDASLVTVDENSFANNEQLEYLDLSRNNFAIFKPLSKNQFRGLKSLQALDLSYCHISSFSDDNLFVYLTSLQYLSLRMNSLYEIDSSFFNQVSCLKAIDLRYNTMVSWNKRLFQSNSYIQEIFLDYNHLTTLSTSMVDDFSRARQVPLRGNTIKCDCELVDTILNNHEINIDRMFSLIPFNSSSDLCSPNKTIVQFLSEKAYSYECQTSKWEVALVVSFIVILSITVLAVIVYHYYQDSIQFAYLTLKERLGLIKFRGRNIPMDKLDGSEKDAFVSYSSEDESFVEKMVFLLEKDGFDLLLYKRDFNAGDNIPDKILESIESSRKTILVLSESFAKSQWCLWELYIAHYRTITLQDSSKDPFLILIKMSEIEESIMSPTLKHLLKTRVYLEWQESPFKQKIFWHQLKQALRAKKETNPKEVLT